MKKTIVLWVVFTLLFGGIPRVLLAAPHNECYIIDTDFDIDDMMAIPVLLGTGKVAAIITTEGYTLPAEGAEALTKLYAEPGLQTHVPTIIGMPYSGQRPRDLSLWPWLPATRSTMNTANRFLTRPPNTSGVPDQTAEKLAVSVKKAVANCNKVSALLIGAFSSYTAYAPAIMGKLKAVVMQGKPFDRTKPAQEQSFNCEYDFSACQLAYEKLLPSKVKPIWVDVPREKLPDGKYAYQPTIAMVNLLEDSGIPGVLKDTLLGYQGTWNAYSPDFPGGTSKLWDQSAALYLIRPGIFEQSPEANYWVPSGMPADQVQALWAASVNHWNRLTRKSISKL